MEYFDFTETLKFERKAYCTWSNEFKSQVGFEILRGPNSSESITQLDVFKNLGLKEHYVFDPEYKYLPNGLIAFHLKSNELREIEIKKGKVFSDLLGLEIVNTGETLRLFNPETKSFLPRMGKLKAELTKLKRQK